MQLSQKLKTIENLLLWNKAKEFSYFKRVNLIGEDKVSYKYYSVIKQKYVGFDVLDGVEIYNQLGYGFTLKNIFYQFFKVNLYKKSFMNESRWGEINNRDTVLAIFNVSDSKIFINSLLDFIDSEKENLTILKKNEQEKEVRNEIDKLKGKFEMLKLPLTFNLSNFLSSYVQYYKTLKSLERQYEILDIQIYQGKITFVLSENISNKKEVIFKENELFIDSQKVFFQRKNTMIFEMIKLIFLYLQENETNKVQFFELEEFYQNNKNLYPQISAVKFNYDYLRKSIETKTKEIERKHHLDKNFLGIDMSGIRCQYLEPENK